MRKDEVGSPEQALSYLADCTLATVSSLRLKKSAPKHELRRQIAIAQTAVDVIKAFKLNCDGTRARDVIDGYGGNVTEWAQTYGPYA